MAQFEDALVMPQQGCRVEDGEYFFLFFFCAVSPPNPGRLLIGCRLERNTEMRVFWSTA